MEKPVLKCASRILLYADMMMILIMVLSALCVFIPGAGPTLVNVSLTSFIILFLLTGPFSLAAALLAGLCSARERGDRTLRRILLGGLAACLGCVVFMSVGLCLEQVSLDCGTESVADYLRSEDGRMFILCIICFASYFYAGVAALLTAYRSYSFEPESAKQNCEIPSIE